MSVVINTNSAATVASNNLAASNTMLQRSLNRLSSGSKIVNPSDDAGGLAVSMKLSAAAKRSGAAATNIGNAVSFLQTQDGVMKVAGKILDRMSELATLYTDKTKNSDDTANYSAEFTQLTTELSNLADEKFNGIALFGSTTALAVSTNEDGSQSVTAAAVDLASDTSGVTISDLSSITDAISAVATDRANNGAYQSVLGFAAETLTVNKANLEAASSRITDVDVAEESTQLARWNVLTQAGTAMLSQANQSAQSALRLLQ
ncbi:MAG TPA: flagellin [Opitutaceae bacterium]|nr:flagellin [Opitutaceae bacterium]